MKSATVAMATRAATAILHTGDQRNFSVAFGAPTALPFASATPTGSSRTSDEPLPCHGKPVSLCHAAVFADGGASVVLLRRNDTVLGSPEHPCAVIPVLSPSTISVYFWTTACAGQGVVIGTLMTSPSEPLMPPLVCAPACAAAHSSIDTSSAAAP